jgi:hypothetical protein
LGWICGNEIPGKTCLKVALFVALSVSLQLPQRIHPRFRILGLEYKEFHGLGLQVEIANLLCRSDGDLDHAPLGGSGSRKEQIPVRPLRVPMGYIDWQRYTTVVPGKKL